MHVRKDDNVIMIAGKDKGKKGKILKAMPKTDMVLVEGVNIKKRHIKARRGGQKGEIIEKSLPVHVSNVALVEARKVVKTAKVKAVKK